MTLQRVKSPDWAVNEVLTSAQMNDVDANIVNALDKRAGQTDVLSSEIDVDGAITFKTGSVLTLDVDSEASIASTQVSVESGGQVFFGNYSLLDMARYSTLDIDADTTFGSFSSIYFNQVPFSGTIKGSLTTASTFTLNASGTFNYTEAHTSNYQTNSTVNYGASTEISGSWKGSLTLASGFDLIGASGSSATLSNLSLDTGIGPAARIGFTVDKNIVRWVQCFGDNETEVDDAGVLSTFQGSGSGTGSCWVTIPLQMLPRNCTLTKITVYFKPNTGHGALPSNFSTLKLYQKDSSSTAAPTQLGSTATDTAASVGAYETGMRSLSVTVSQAVDVVNYRYVATFQSESGTNTVQGMKIHGAKVEFTTSYMDEY